jgi:DNA polymerase-3 subunit epsilon
MEFVALDVETANPDMSSICQIGIAGYADGSLANEWTAYVDPQDFFNAVNVSIHGINETMVRGAPTLPEVAAHLFEHLDGRVVVCHTHFDRVAIHQAFTKHGLRIPGCTWLDSARVARRAWEEFAWGGYGLSNVCEVLGYRFTHHDALEDAKASAHVLMAAIAKTGIDLKDWLVRATQPISAREGIARARQGMAQEGNPEGALYGEVLVFTGSLAIRRREAAELAAKIGCTVADGVTKATTILVVGDQDVNKLLGNEKSSKHRKAEELILKGQVIRILMESDFKELVGSAV